MQRNPGQYKEQQQLSRPHRNDERRGFPWRPDQPGIPPTGQRPASLALHRQARPVNVRPAPGRGTAALAARGNGGHRSQLLPRGIPSVVVSAAPAASSGSPVPGGRGGRGARPAFPPSAGGLGQGRLIAANKWQAERQRSCSQESFASEHSLYSTPSQASNCSMSGTRQQQVRKMAKPPRPPGPPPPHILEEQRQRREMAALQRSQQHSPNSSAAVAVAGGAGAAAAAGGGTPPYGGEEQRNLSTSRSFGDCRRRNNTSPRNRQVGDPTHLVQAGASILSNGSGLHLIGARSEDPAVGYGLEAAAGFSHNKRESAGERGGVTVLTPPISGPLCLTSPQVESQSAMKEGELPSPSSPKWQEFWDEEVEASYYYNCGTGEALWVRPDGF